MLRSLLLSALVCSSAAYALDDIPVYLDAGCAYTGIPGSPADGASATIGDVKGTKSVPITCTEQMSGTDAIVLNVTSGWAYYAIKMSTDRGQSIKGYTDVRMWVKNKGTTAAKFSVNWQKANYTEESTSKNISVPVGTGWQEVVIPLSDLVSDSVAGFYFHVTNKLNVLVDSITVTDGTKNGSLSIPASVRKPAPASWPSTFLIGSFDNREVGKSTVAAQAGGTYRYQYVMPETQGYYTASKKGYVYDYILESKKLGVKTALVWYNLGKSGEGYSPVVKNLASASYMAEYFTRFDSVLTMMVNGGQKDYMLILEPDMYGFLLRGPQGAAGMPIDDPTKITVDMTKANALAGKTYAPNMVGWAEFLVQYAKKRLASQGVIIGHMPNHWGVNIPGQVGQGRKEAHLISAMTIARFINNLGPDGKGDVVFVEKSDHDAGHKPENENWLWDSTGYAKYFLWTKAISHETNLPIVGWQVSEGNMSNVQKWKDNAAEHFLANPDRWMDGGFIGILFGAGNSDCVNFPSNTANSDGGWFDTKMTEYSKAPVSLTGTTALRTVAGSALQCLCVRRVGSQLLLQGWMGSARVQVRSFDGRLLLDRVQSSSQPLELGSYRGMAIVSLTAPSLVRSGTVFIP